MFIIRLLNPFVQKDTPDVSSDTDVLFAFESHLKGKQWPVVFMLLLLKKLTAPWFTKKETNSSFQMIVFMFMASFA